MEQNKTGSIVCVGVGMTLGSHISPLSRSHIEQADVVFCSVSDSYVELWIKEMNSNVRSLQSLYAQGKDRRQTYREMVEVMMREVRAGKKVVGAFYGHPGVFALAPHKVIEVARNEGFHAHMEPGISAEDCLYADLGIDPGTFGCQHYEASQFMLYARQFDTTAYLVLWQIGSVGDRKLEKFDTENKYRSVLKQVLARHYPDSHELIIYVAAVLPVDQARLEKVTLGMLDKVKVHQHSTLVIPPYGERKRDLETLQLLEELN